jgi:hypothetical protein
MARPVEVSAQIQVLLDQKRKHVEALSTINQTLDRIAAMLGGSGGNNGSQARPTEAATETPAPMKTRRTKRTRRQFGMTAADFVLAFVKQHKKPTTREINAHWKSAGRGFTADVTLGKLVKDKKLKRSPLVGERGSRYSLG